MRVFSSGLANCLNNRRVGVSWSFMDAMLATRWGIQGYLYINRLCVLRKTPKSRVESRTPSSTQSVLNVSLMSDRFGHAEPASNSTQSPMVLQVPSCVLHV